MSNDDHTLGFGAPKNGDPHRFVIDIPESRNGCVRIIEDFGAAGWGTGQRQIARVRIPRATWRAVADGMKTHLNHRLRANKIKTGSFRTGLIPVERLLGREITVLAWAIEDMSPENAAACVPKWANYRHEELWWLFNQIERDAGAHDDVKTGWRLGVTHIFMPPQPYPQGG